ncbi:hypothetical protein R50073_18640 [Maricurvus nonylphenolicus]
MAKPDIQQALQFRDGQANGRAANVEFDFGGTEAAALNHRLVDPQQAYMGIPQLAGQKVICTAHNYW